MKTRWILAFLLVLALPIMALAAVEDGSGTVSHDQSASTDWQFGAIVIGTTDLGTPALNATATVSMQVAKITIANNCNIDFTGWPASGTEGKKVLYMVNPGAATITWKSNGTTLVPNTTLLYAGGTAPTWTASGTDIFVFTSIDGGTTVYCFTAGEDMK